MIKIISLITLILFGYSWKQITGNNQVKNSHELTREPASLGQYNLEGDLIAVVDDMSQKSDSIEYYLKDNLGNEIRLPLNSSQVNSQYLGKRVVVASDLKGKINLTLNETTKLRTKSNLEQVALESQLAKTYKEIILLFKFNNSEVTYVNKDEIYQQVYNGGYNSYFHDLSDGRIHHDGEVYGWYQLNRNGSIPGLMFDCEIRNHEILEMVQFYRIDLTQYDNVITVSNCTEYNTIGGRALLHPYDFLSIGKAQTYIKMAANPPLLVMNANPDLPPLWGGLVPILVHERAHNFGILHANALDCGDSLVLHPCQHIEYGNRFDRLGSPDGANYINAHLQKTGKFKTDNDFWHIKENSSLFVDQINSKKKDRKIGAYIYKQGTNLPLFMIESRKPSGFDGSLKNWLFRNVANGVLVYTT